MDTNRTKIVCTLGPVSSSKEMIVKLLEAGMDIVRLNFSHGSHESHAETIINVRAAAKDLGIRVPILQDLSGPKLRTGKLTEEPVELIEGAAFTLTAEDVPGSAEKVSMNCPELVADVNVGDTILLGDGDLILEITEKTDVEIITRVKAGGALGSRKGICAPGVSISAEVPTEKDIADVKFGISQGVDLVALSFVRNAGEIRKLRRIMEDNGGAQKIIAKIEKREALDDLDNIIEAVDGIMIARGDLGLEMPIYDVPHYQKVITQSVNRAAKPVITATQMLESMVHNPRPTRAEVTDIANAIFDGTDAVMLSGETATGKYPVDAVRTMDQVACSTEANIDYKERLKKFAEKPDDVNGAIAYSACHLALEVDAKAIICVTASGYTARLVSQHRPHACLVVVSQDEKTLQECQLLWGAFPLKVERYTHTDAMILAAKAAVLEAGLAQSGDRVVIVAGVPPGVAGTTNMIKVDRL